MEMISIIHNKIEIDFFPQIWKFIQIFILLQMFISRICVA